MTTAVFLVFMSLASAPPPTAVVVQEMPDMRTCESIGSQLAAMALPSRSKWTCIEGAR